MLLINCVCIGVTLNTVISHHFSCSTLIIILQWDWGGILVVGKDGQIKEHVRSKMTAVKFGAIEI